MSPFTPASESLEAKSVMAPDAPPVTRFNTKMRGVPRDIARLKREIEKKLKILGIVMAGMNLEVEADYMIERSWVGNPEEDDQRTLFV